MKSKDYEYKYAQALNFYDAGKYDYAKQLLDQVKGYYRSNKEFEDIFLKYAYCSYHLKDYLLAAHHFEQFVVTFPNSTYKQDAEYMAAYSNYQQSASYRLDQTATEDAIDEFQLFINRNPESEKVEASNRIIDELRSKLELKAFENAELYHKIGEYQSAIHSFENILKDFPETKRTEEIRYNLVQSAYHLATKSTLKKQEERYKVAVDKAQLFKKKFPSSSHLYEVEKVLINSNYKIKILEQDVRY